MKRILLSLGALSLFSAMHASAPLQAIKTQASEVRWSDVAPKHMATASPEKKEKKWDYWSVGLGLGASYITDISWLFNMREAVLPDGRLSIEKSFYLSDNVTLAVDLALCTPTVRLGTPIGKNGRFSIGAGIPLFFLRGRTHTKPSSREGTRGMDSGHEEAYHVRNNIPVTPSISYDHFITKNAFVRASLTYDQLVVAPVTRVRKFNGKPGEYTERIRWEDKNIIHWPGLMVSVNLRF